MLLTDPMLYVPGPSKPERVVVPALRRLARAWREQRRLLDWNRTLPRPMGCTGVPSRVWLRHSALLSLRGGTPRPGL